MHPHFLRTYCLLPMLFGSWGVKTIDLTQLLHLVSVHRHKEESFTACLISMEDGFDVSLTTTPGHP